MWRRLLGSAVYRRRMRIFLTGATGVIGVRLVPLLAAAGHEIAGMTRSQEKAESLRTLGAEPVVCNVFDAGALRDAVVGFCPQVVVHQLTDLPDDLSQLSEFAAANARIRREGTRNLIDASVAAKVSNLVAQSVAWKLDGDAGAAVEEHERAVLDAGGVVVRYGRFYGPGTYSEMSDPPPPPRVHVDDAARRTLPLLEAASGVVTVTE